MAKIDIYTTDYCPYCHAALALLDRKGAAYDVIPVDGDPELRQAMTRRANGRYTVPQIFIGSVHVGGYDDLAALDRRGALDPLLKGLG
jgi:glutaredoxin 3